MSRTANSRRLVVMTRRKLAASPWIPALSRMAVSARNCSSAPNTGLRTKRLRSGLSAIKVSKRSRSALTASTALLSSANSNRALPYRPAMPEMIGSLAATGTLVFVDTSQGGRRRGAAAQIIGIQEGIPIREDGAGARGNPHEFEALANIGAGAVQHGVRTHHRDHPARRAAAHNIASQGCLAMQARPL